MPNNGKDGRIDIGYGTLNNVEEQNFGRTLDPRNSSGIDIVRQVAVDSFKKNTIIGTGPYKGIVLRVDTNPSNNPITSWVQKVNILSKTRKTLKVRIPELHAALLEPFNYGPNCGPSNHIIDMYPSFVPESEEAANAPVAPGDIVWVDFGNRYNMTDPIYKGIAFANAQGGAVGRDSVKGMFDTAKKPPLGVLAPAGNNPTSNTKLEEVQLPEPITLQQTRTSETTVGSFTPQREHVESPDGMPPMTSPAIAYKNGNSIGSVDLVEIPVPIATKDGIFIVKQQEKPFYDLINAAKKDNIIIRLNSGFRSNEQQKYLYEGWIDGSPNFNKAAKPGYSLHQAGNAFDFAVGGSANTEIYRWLVSNGHKFGFYNAGRFFKEQKEHWHFVYLGINHPTILAEGKAPLSEKLKSFA